MDHFYAEEYWRVRQQTPWKVEDEARLKRALFVGKIKAWLMRFLRPKCVFVRYRHKKGWKRIWFCGLRLKR